jgi:hypothetical protein
MKVWIAKRAESKPVDPGMMDLIVGGGQPMGISPWNNLMKECQEEAGMPRETAEQAKSVGIITLLAVIKGHMRVGLQFNYDLELPESFRPRNTDGEVEEFILVPVSALIDRLKSADDFSYDVAVVLIDFLVRHGFVGPTDTDFLELIAELRRPIPWIQ